jgi:hypothetical protein
MRESLFEYRGALGGSNLELGELTGALGGPNLELGELTGAPFLQIQN